VKVVIVDGDNRCYQYGHATDFEIPMSKGLMSVMGRIYKTYRPDLILVAWEGMSTFRDRIDSDYKAGRGKMPDHVYDEIKDAREVLKSYGIINVASNDFEADDTIATLIRGLVEYGNTTQIIISSEDKDLYQCLIRPYVFIETQSTKFGKVYGGLINDERFTEYWGFEPRYWIFYQFLTGDSGDKIKGVPGIGPKGSKELLTLSWIDVLNVDEWNELPSIDEHTLNKIGYVKPNSPFGKLRKFLIEKPESAMDLWNMVRLRTKCNLILDREFNQECVFAIKKEHQEEFKRYDNLFNGYRDSAIANLLRVQEYFGGNNV
jgi:5'-3' exonuclease